ncbi:DUF6456 domain-containing protein [Wenxinia saemankumensis]|uniref:Helix-turn-helix domain-containing protein n=1 Tax=Wenxinia saemankumensis TaxID=1447782 RepID=A0A1M6A7U4_9RHOB|nr:DUF6456 domain-containing protein [Wenxinia saemankumensis]SHI32542.1 Helix-turn-helix domain-containing protein [Wenxinia saemankumensis]
MMTRHAFDDRYRPAMLPGWVPDAVRNYLLHTDAGQSIRAIAREAGVHPSTILRQVRRIEGRRDDPLVDEGLRDLGAPPGGPDDILFAEAPRLEAAALPILSELDNGESMLALARGLDRGVVVRDSAGGEPERVAIVDRALARAMALAEWIAASDPGARVLRYRLTGAGRSLLGAARPEAGLAEAPAPFRRSGTGDPEGMLRHARSALAESPLVSLARRRDRDGRPFLSRSLVAVGERLREDFELARLEGDPGIDWHAAIDGRGPADRPDTPSGRAADRLWRALRDLGPGLADVALRCCCELEGLETLERSLGWSSRSAKVVLRIALQRLKAHYDAQGAYGPVIG